MANLNQIGRVPRPRVNGGMLSNYVGKPVSLLGHVQQVNSDGRSFKLTASDNETVIVQLREPLNMMLESLVEVQGIVTPSKSVLCNGCTTIPKSAAENFNKKLYNEAVLLMAQHPDLYVASENTSGFI